MSTGRPTKAVIPVAGLGTRFLPATKSVPKEMLPVVDKPAIQYVVEEAVAAGLSDVLMVTGRNKTAIEDHFDRNVELELALEAKGDTDRLARVQESTNLAQIHYVRQGDPRGLGHAVLVAAAARRGRAVRRAARRRPDRRARPAARPHDRGAGDPRRVGGRADGGAAAPDPPLRLRGGHRHRRRGRVRRHRSGREAAGRRGAEQPRRHRSLRAAPGGLRRAARHASRTRGRDPADRRAGDAGRHAGGRGRRRARRGLPRPPLRHRRPRRLPQGGRPAGQRAGGPGPEFRAWLAEFVREQERGAGDQAAS